MDVWQPSPVVGHVKTLIRRLHDRFANVKRMRIHAKPGQHEEGPYAMTWEFLDDEGRVCALALFVDKYGAVRPYTPDGVALSVHDDALYTFMSRFPKICS